MKKVSKIMMLVLMTSIMATVGCTKEGKEGVAGTNGKDGNANVQSTILEASSTGNWTWNSGASWREATWTRINQLSAEAINSGGIMLYQQDGSGNYFPLPITVKYGGITENDWFTFGQESVTVVVQNLDNSDPIGQIPIPTRYRLVVIPPAARLANPEVNMMNYYEVKGFYNLKD